MATRAVRRPLFSRSALSVLAGRFAERRERKTDLGDFSPHVRFVFASEKLVDEGCDEALSIAAPVQRGGSFADVPENLLI